ncbi:hypothetical protein GOODEAATRI_026962, partial [Goodea atripinnis]
FGKYEGKSFRWILENDRGYVVYLNPKLRKRRELGSLIQMVPKKEAAFLFWSTFATTSHFHVFTAVQTPMLCHQELADPVLSLVQPASITSWPHSSLTAAGSTKNIFPAYLTHKKGLCRTVLDELRRSGRSPNDMANRLNEALHLKYERAQLSYLSSVKNVLDGEIGLYGQKIITASLRTTTTPAPFGGYADADGWFVVTVEAYYLDDCLTQEYRRQEDTLNLLLQGTFGQAFRAGHTWKVARKVMLGSGTMSSYGIMNKNWMILS